MIILASMETEFSSHGGLGAVMKLLPREIGGSDGKGQAICGTVIT